MDIALFAPSPVFMPLMLRAVSAGFPSPADDHVENEIDLQALLVRNRPATFLVRVSGDSMIGARLFDGDLAVVDRSLVPRSGDVVVVDIDGERSFKVWSRDGGKVKLTFANPQYPAFHVDDDAIIEIWGVLSSSISVARRSGRS
jgi:DNA polymerase V